MPIKHVRKHTQSKAALSLVLPFSTRPDAPPFAHLCGGDFFPRQGQFILQKQETSSGSDNHKKERHADRCGARNRGHFISIWIAPSKWKYVLICKTNKACEVQVWLETFDFYISEKHPFFSQTLWTQLRFAWRGSLNEVVESCHSIHESINFFLFLFEPHHWKHSVVKSYLDLTCNRQQKHCYGPCTTTHRWLSCWPPCLVTQDVAKTFMD